MCRQCRKKHACHLKQFLSSQQPTSENIAAKSNPPRKRFPIPPEMFSSPSGMNNSALISDEDYKQPPTPANAKTAYNQYVYKLHEATEISEPFRYLDFVLMKDLHPRTKHYYQGRSQTSEQDEANLGHRRREPLGGSEGKPPPPGPLPPPRKFSNLKALECSFKHFSWHLSSETSLLGKRRNSPFYC